MNNDRELLEQAAKAVGYKHEVSPIDPQPNRPAYWSNWNPLTSDGDALRLAVKLEMELDLLPKRIAVRTNIGIKVLEDYADDPYAATRRAIVRAAAEIGKGL